MRSSILLLILTLLTFGVRGQAAREPAFKVGEELAYAVSYKVGFITTDVAEVVLSVHQEGPDFRITGTGKVYPSYRWFFDMNDMYQILLDGKTLRPKEFVSEISEGKYRFSSRFSYDWNRMRVKTTYRNHKRPEPKHKQMMLGPQTLDGLSLFYNLRNTNISEYKPGSSEQLSLLLEDTVRSIRFTFIKRETKQVKGLGRCKVLKFSCQLATSEGESFEDGSEFFVWISDDANKIPLYVESPIRVGSIRARLIRSANLKYPFDHTPR